MFVYVITSLVSGKRYVGKANMPATRWTAHKTVARQGAKTPLYRDMRQHGIEAFSFEVVEECSSEAESYDAERRWIARLGTTDPSVGYNLTSGGQGLTDASEATRRKMSEAKRGKAHSAEFAEKRASGIRANGKKAAVLARVLELHGQGLNQYQIAETVGRTQARVNQLLKESGIMAQSHQGRKYTRAENAATLREAIDLRAEGVSYEVIAERLTRSVSTIHTMLQKHFGLEKSSCDT